MLVRYLLLVIRLRALVYVATILLAAYGVVAMLRLPVDALPNLSENQVLVYSRWSDHDPDQIDQEVTRPLAAALRQTEGVQAVRGASNVGFSLITMIFSEAESLTAARDRVDKLVSSHALKLPEGVRPQVAAEGIATGQIVWYSLQGQQTDLVELRSWQDHFIAPRLQQLPGVAEVATVGGFEPEINIQLDGDALQRAGLSLDQVWQQLKTLKMTGPTHTVSVPVPYATSDLWSILRDFNDFPIRTQTQFAANSSELTLGQIADLSVQPVPRYGSFEQDGVERVAGVVHMRPGANTLTVTRDVLEALRQIQRELPPGWTCLPCYDRQALIGGSLWTVVRTLTEALLVTTVCIVLVMRHFRSSLIIAVSLPLSVLGAVLGMYWLSTSGSSINANIMSLAGIAVSVGILIDAAVVIVENVSYRLRQQFVDQRVVGSTDVLVAQAAAQVAWPATMAIIIMIVSILPMFALSGLDGQMMRPLLWTKTFTLVSVVVLSLTLVPCLARDFVRGHIQSERDSRVLRGIVSVYQPVLQRLFDSPAPIVILLMFMAVLASAVTGVTWFHRLVCVVAAGLVWISLVQVRYKLLVTGLLLVSGLAWPSMVEPISIALRLPLDEGMIMDMPITLPRTTMLQATDDLKARNMILCRFPEIEMVSGKAGRAETPFDPAPIDMIETMIEYRPQSYWPRRRLTLRSARQHAAWLTEQLIEHQMLEPPTNFAQLIDEVIASGLPRFDAVQREVCWQAMQELREKLSVELTAELVTYLKKNADSASRSSRSHRQIIPAATAEDTALSEVELIHGLPQAFKLLLAKELNLNTLQIVADQVQAQLQRSTDANDSTERNSQISERHLQLLLERLQASQQSRYRQFTTQLNRSLQQRVGQTWTQIVLDELFTRVAIIDEDLIKKRLQSLEARYGTRSDSNHHGDQHQAIPGTSALPMIDPHIRFDRLVQEASQRLTRSAWLWPHTPATLTDPAGELDQAVQMPGWANVWTRPIQNRIDMLTTGVNSEVGIRVLGDDLNQVVATSEAIAKLVTDIPGAVGVIADPIRGRDYVRFQLDQDKMKRAPWEPGECQLASEAATTGLVGKVELSTSNQFGSTSVGLRVLLRQPAKGSSPGADQSDPLRSTRIPLKVRADSTEVVTLNDLGELEHFDGPSMIKSIDGRICNYVRLNVINRSASDWVQEAKMLLATQSWPAGIEIEWTGQFEHAQRTTQLMTWLIPVCALVILVMLWASIGNVIDTLLVVLALPGAMIGSVLAQWLLGLPVSLSVVIGFISCLGMAAATGMVMLVYLKDAVQTAERNSGRPLSLKQLREAVMRGAVHRLRPKLLTEVAMIVSLLPVLWSVGAGADVIRPMAAPVLGGIFIADEVIDLLLPALYYRICRRRWLKANSPLNFEDK